MRIVLRTLAVTALLLMPVLASAAPGLAMRWDRCYGDGGVANKDFACNTNSGTEKLVLSFKTPADMDSVSGNEITVMLEAPGSSLPAWWQFKNTGTCRATSLSVNSTISPDAVACLDEFAGNATSGIGAYSIGFDGANRARLLVSEAVPLSALAALTADQEYFALNIQIDHRKTVGTGTCAGCVTPMCLLFSKLIITRAYDEPSVTIVDALGPNSLAVGWQGGSPSLHYLPQDICGGLGCDYKGWYLDSCALPTPARLNTWGSIKSLYR